MVLLLLTAHRYWDSPTIRGLLTGLVSPLQLKLSDLFLFWNILIPVHNILLWKQRDLEGGPIKPRVQKNESRNLWSQPPEGIQKPSTCLTNTASTGVLSFEPVVRRSISRGLKVLGECKSPYPQHLSFASESKVNWCGPRMTPLRLASSRG